MGGGRGDAAQTVAGFERAGEAVRGDEEAEGGGKIRRRAIVLQGSEGPLCCGPWGVGKTEGKEGGGGQRRAGLIRREGQKASGKGEEP